jgi:hypothetical protein
MVTYLRSTAHASLHPTITGRSLAKIQWSKARRARFAGLLVAGEIDLERLTLKQAAALCGVPVSSIPRRNGNGHTRKPVPTLADRIEAASPEERVAAAKAFGIERVWDEMLSPIVSARWRSEEKTERRRSQMGGAFH